MTVDGPERRLAAIVFADVVGFSRMMADDEDGTLSALRAHRNVVDPVVLNHGGRIVKSTGDGILVEFPSATAAVRAAVEVQDLMAVRIDALPESRRMQFRIGINLTEIVVDETGDVFGDGVNIAARVESVADPGGVSVTDAVFVAVRDKLEVDFTDDGEHELKNIPRPVRVWKIGAAPAARPGPTRTAERTIATVAVLPFENMSGDPEQEYFADGITEDLLTALSCDQDIAVVARNSTFAYRGSATDVRIVARELDATHVIEGSVRRSGSRIRINAQLIDAESGRHVWAETYDRELDDVFELQDELVDTITARLRPSLWQSAGERRETSNARSVDAWDLTIRGQFHLRRHTIDGYVESLELFDQARRLDAEFVAPVAGAAEACCYLHLHGWRRETANPLKRFLEDAEAAYRLDRDHYQALGVMAAARVLTRRPEDGAQHARRMIELNPHAPNGYHLLGGSLLVAGQFEDSIIANTTAWRLGRREPMRYDIANDLAWAHYLTGNYEAALTWGQESLQLVDDYLQAHLVLAATHGQLGRASEGQRHVTAILTALPGFSALRNRSQMPSVRDEDRDHFVDGLLKAGLP